MELTFWEWAARQGYNMTTLAEKLGYSPEHLSRLKNDHYPITRDFAARCVLTFGDVVRPFFVADLEAAS